MQAQTPVIPLPRRFRRLRVLILGCGDVGLRLIRAYGNRANILATCRRPEQASQIRDHGARPLLFDLDTPRQRRRPEATANYLVYLAPPDARRVEHTMNRLPDHDPRLQQSLARALRSRYRARARHSRLPPPPNQRRIAYASTTGVFGDSGGKLLSETTTANPQSARGRRRLAAEQSLRRHARRRQFGTLLASSIYRAPGIYAADRLPLQRFERKQPCLEPEHDSYSSHIHADDLARILWFGLFRGRTSRTYIASDGQRMKMGDYFDQIADALSLPRPQRLPAQAVREQVSEMTWSFMRESRQLSNARLLRELRFTPRYPTVADTLRELADPAVTPEPTLANTGN